MNKGIVLAGGAGTRLHPATIAISKQLLPIYDRPMIYFPIYTLMSGGIKDILIISTRTDLPLFKKLLGTGSQWGIRLKYAVQERPKGIAQSLQIAEKIDFLKFKDLIVKESSTEPRLAEDTVTLILGDNIFHGNVYLKAAIADATKFQLATIYTYNVKDPSRYGVFDFTTRKIVEKPKNPTSNAAVTGLYVYPCTPATLRKIKSLRPSKRGELEITDLNRAFLENDELIIRSMNRGNAWLDTGTHESMLQASQFVQTIEDRQGIKISCPEELALCEKWITPEQLRQYLSKLGNSSYRTYLETLLKNLFT